MSIPAREYNRQKRPVVVRIRNLQRRVRVPRQKIMTLVQLAAPPEWSGNEVSVAIVNDSRMRELNSRFTGTDAATDVLAFPLERGRGASEGDVLGEIVASGETALREAAERGVPPEAELALYVIHGVLHLLGYRDHTDADRNRMYRKESTLLRKVGLQSTRRAKSRRGLTADRD